jgi:hypothetical protein
VAEKKKLKTENQDRSCSEIWNAIDKAVLDTYGCLLPSGNVTIPLELPWTKEKVLWLLKRQGRISSWRLDREYSEGNKRRYLVTVDTDRI